MDYFVFGIGFTPFQDNTEMSKSRGTPPDGFAATPLAGEGGLKNPKASFVYEGGAPAGGGGSQNRLLLMPKIIQIC
jgi:hypothetical protein